MRTYPLRDVSRWLGKDLRTLRRWGFGAELTHEELFEACKRAGLCPFWLNENAFHVSGVGVWVSLEHFSGGPCIAHTGISTEIAASRFMAGESIESLVSNYRVDAWRIEAAIRWEAKR